MKIAVVQMGIEDEDLVRHLLMHAARHTDRSGRDGRQRCLQKQVVGQRQREEVQEQGQSRGKGKAKDKNKERDPAANVSAEMMCYHCHRKGHRKREARRQQRTLVERSPAESHVTMGAMERANRTLEEMLRTMKHATEMRVGGKLETGHHLISWMIRHCCWIFCSYHVRADGRTSSTTL